MKKRLVIVAALVLISSLVAWSVYAASSIKLVVNGKEIKPDVPPQMIGGRVMVPIRFVAEALGANVQWDAKNNTVIITSGGTPSPAPSTPDDTLNADGFEFKNVSIKPFSLGGVEIIGEVTNKSGKSYKGAIFTLSLYDAGGKLLATEFIAVENIPAGATKSWRTYSLNIDPASVKSYKFQFDSGY